jgi:branched-chain amino acid transport system permease protein
MPTALTTTEVVASGRFSRTKPSLLSTSLRSRRYWRVRRDDARQAAAILDALGLARFADREAASLPLGTRRLVEVGRALAAGAQVLLLDEVAAGLDEAELDHLAGILRTIRDAGLTVVLVEHNFDLVLRLADLIYVLSQGRLVAAGPPDQIRANVEVERVYLGRTPDSVLQRGFESLLGEQASGAAPAPRGLAAGEVSRPGDPTSVDAQLGAESGDPRADQ